MALPPTNPRIAMLMALFYLLPASAEENLVTIHSPADGENLEAGQTYKLQYEVKAAAKADHVHLFVDGDEVAIAHKLKGSFTLGPLKTGPRKVCISPVNKNHTAVAGQACVNVIVQ